MYIKTSNNTVEKYPYSLSNLKKDFPNTSFPKEITEDILEDFGVHKVSIDDQPSFDENIERITTEDMPVLVNGVWTLSWKVEPLTAEQSQEIYQYKSESIRAERNFKLQNSDWVISKATEQNAIDGLGIQIPQVWIDYRQALRDIPQQDGFPFNVIWPDEP